MTFRTFLVTTCFLQASCAKQVDIPDRCVGDRTVSGVAGPVVRLVESNAEGPTIRFDDRVLEVHVDEYCWTQCDGDLPFSEEQPLELSAERNDSSVRYDARVHFNALFACSSVAVPICGTRTDKMRLAPNIRTSCQDEIPLHPTVLPYADAMIDALLDVKYVSGRRRRVRVQF